MILLFPNLDTFHLALAKDMVPREVILAPAAVTFDAQGQIYLEPTAPLPKIAIDPLKRIGVKGSKRHATDEPVEVASWVQVVPVAREPGTPNLSSQAAVLFELSHADDLPTLVAEMLRLGNDRQSFRWFSTDGDGKSVLLRVIGPPYYTLLRALDKTAAGTAGTVRAYLERAPRVWVEVGHTHPLASQVRVAEGQIVLIRPPREWLFLDDLPFQDVYDITQFHLPAAPVAWSEAKAPKKMTVPLRLTAGNAADVAELWVLRDQGAEQLDALVRDGDERLTQRLMFAVAADAKGNRIVVLRTRPSKLAPPVLPLENAMGFKPYWKLPNLFLPTGKRLHPTLRRDAVRRLLAEDADQVVWLYPDGQGGFTPEGIPDEAFRSLQDWVEYVIESERQPLATWIDATRFDFDHFICKDTGGPKVKPDKGDKEPRGKDDGDEGRTAKAAGTAVKAASKGKPAAKPSGAAEFLPPLEPKPRSEWKIKREQLEKQFLAIEGPLDAPERQALWPELAVVNAGLAAANTGDEGRSEAAVCWLNALWDGDPMPAEWLGGWLRSEFPQAKAPPRAEEFDKLLNTRNISPSDARGVVASFLWVAHQNPIPAWLLSRLPAVQKYLEAHEASLPVRAVWLAGYRLAQLAGADVLGLARVRDRLLQRLLERGLDPERDLPIFLRTAGQNDSDRLRTVRDRAADLHQTVRRWSEHIPQNLPYIDLLFAFAFAKLGETTAARKLLEGQKAALVKPVPTAPEFKDFDRIVGAISNTFLYRAFAYRIEQAIAGQPASGHLPEELLAELVEFNKKSQMPEFRVRGRDNQSDNPFGRAVYVIARLREQLRILEPQGVGDPYAPVTRHSDLLKKAIAELPEIRDPSRLVHQIRTLCKEGVREKVLAEVRFHVLYEALPLSPRVGEAFAVELLNMVPGALAAGATGGAGFQYPDTPEKMGKMLARAMFLAAHYDRRDIVQQLVSRFSELVHAKFEAAGKRPDQSMDGFVLINAVAGQALRSLRKIAARDEIDRFFLRLQREALGGAGLRELKARYGKTPPTWAAVLETMLNLAAAWMTFGLDAHAQPIIEEVRTELLSGSDLPPKEYTQLARAYVSALGHGPCDLGIQRITELFRKMERGRLTNPFTTGMYYSRFHLNIVEDVILAVVSDEFALGPAGRQWLDDDEYLVRRRIHADMKRHLEKSGL